MTIFRPQFTKAAAKPPVVNGLYPIDYFQLAGVTKVVSPDTSFWSSRARYAALDPTQTAEAYLPIAQGGSPTVEYLELDLGRVREVNFLNMAILRAPLNVSIEYDALSATDGSHEWVGVTPTGDAQFDDVITFDADFVRSPWLDASYFFGTKDGYAVSTRYLRISFERQDVGWPKGDYPAFPWSVYVQNLRTAHYVASTADAIGSLAAVDIDGTTQRLQLINDTSGSGTSYDVRQTFGITADMKRGTITPQLMGFGFLADVPRTTSLADVQYAWNLCNSAGEILRSGTISGAANDGRVWLDAIFDHDPLVVAVGDTYEMRVRTLAMSASSGVYINLPSPNSYQLKAWNSGTNAMAATAGSLTYRLWADVGESGTDVLGNQYRYAAVHEGPTGITTGLGWTSAPNPSPEGVESLYMDVRTSTDLGYDLTVVDSISVTPRTPGLYMHVYYSTENLHGEAPTKAADWDHLLWSPVNQSYTLRGDMLIQLPHAVRAAFLKFEFTNLRPMPVSLPTYPELPPVEYKRHPTWIETQFANASVRRVVEDWFLHNATQVSQLIASELRDPVAEFEYKEREFLTALAQGVADPEGIAAGLIDPAAGAFIDPTTASRIYLSGRDSWARPLVATLRPGSILAQAVQMRYDPRGRSYQTEKIGGIGAGSQVPLVSSSNDRVSESFSHLAQTPMWFNRTCRHDYRTEKGKYHKKAYFAGIKSLTVWRNDYTVEHDSAIVDDILHDDSMLELNTFARHQSSSIPISTNGTTNAYVSYVVNGQIYTDEAVSLDDSPIKLAGVGGPARNVVVSSLSGGRGTSFAPNDDYTISYGIDELGRTTNTIARTTAHDRLEVDVAVARFSYDADMIIAHLREAVGLPNEDAARVTAHFSLGSFIEGRVYADGVAFTDLEFIPQPHVKTGAIPTVVVAPTVTVSGTETHYIFDNGLIPATVSISGSDSQVNADGATLAPSITISAVESFVAHDAATVSPSVSISDVERYAALDPGANIYIPPTLNPAIVVATFTASAATEEHMLPNTYGDYTYGTDGGTYGDLQVSWFDEYTFTPTATLSGSGGE